MSIGLESHALPAARSLKRWILPVAVFGSSGTNSIQRGYLYGASRLFTCCCSAAASSGVGGVVGAQHDEGLRFDQSVIVAVTHDRGFEHRLVGGERGFDLEGDTQIPLTLSISSARPQ